MAGLENLKISDEKKRYITESLNPLLEEMVTEALTSMPENPVIFLLDWLKAKKAKADEMALSPEERERVMKENEQLKADLITMTSKVEETAKMVTAGNEAKDEEEEEEEEDDDDELDEIPESFKKPEGQMKTARASVSAEAYGAWNQKKAFTPPSIPKSDQQLARLKTVLGKIFLFQSLEEKDMNGVIGAMQEKVLEPKTRIINQGDDGDFLFVIESGVLDCYIKKEEGEVLVATREAGDAFGELALLYNCPRAASVESRERCTLWQLDRETFNHIVKESAQKKREKHEAFLKEVPLLSTMDAYSRSQIADALKTEEFKDGETIVKENEEGNKFYLLEDGEAVASKAGAPVMDYKAGMYFGELALLKNQPRAATVTSKGTCKVLSLDRGSFKRLLGPLDELLGKEANKYK